MYKAINAWDDRAIEQSLFFFFPNMIIFRGNKKRYMYRRYCFLMTQQLLNVFEIVCKKENNFSTQNIKYSNIIILFSLFFFLICDWIDESSCTFRIQFLQKKEFIVQFYNLEIIVQQYEPTFSFPFPNTSVLILSD